jgi:acetylornithine deacetylase/succinyl-diaminopimelate desuccinylase-like protein
VRAYLARYGPSRGVGELVELLASPDRLVREHDRFDRLTPFLRALFRDELHPLAIAEEADGELGFEAWFHLLPGTDVARAAERLLGDSRRLGVAVSPVREFGAGPASPLDHADYATLERAVAERFPAVAVGPYFLPWAMTDAHHFRAAGIPSYGFSPFPVVVFDTTGVARANERMQLPAFRAGVELYRDAVRRLTD